MRLTQTAEGRAWLRQFDPADLALAERLLDDLAIVPAGAFTARMRGLARSVVAATSEPLGFFPVWEVEMPVRDPAVPAAFAAFERPLAPTESVFPLAALAPQAPQAPGTSGTRTPAGASPSSSAPAGPPLSPLGGVDGSVGSAVHLIGDLRKEFGGERVLDRPSLDTLRAARCRHIVLVDDIVASGTRTLRFLQAFYRHPTIKSWCSRPGLRFTVVCYAAADAGLRALRTYDRGWDVPRPLAPEVCYEQRLVSGRAFWTPAERSAFETLCRTYARRTGRPRMPLGFRNAFTMVAFPYAVPNTAPAIFWSGSARWRPLFPGRAVPAPLLAQFDHLVRDPAGADLSETLRRIGHLRLAHRPWGHEQTPHYRALVLLLAILARGAPPAAWVADVLQLGRTETAALLAAAQAAGLVEPGGTLTHQGRAELRAARAHRTRPWDPPALDESRFYVPSSLTERRGFM